MNQIGFKHYQKKKQRTKLIPLSPHNRDYMDALTGIFHCFMVEESNGIANAKESLIKKIDAARLLHR